MLNLSDKELDHFAKEAAQEYDPGDVLGERSWEGLEIRLDRDLGKVHLNPLGHIRRFPFYYAPAMLVLLGVSYYLIRRTGSPPGRVVKAPAVVVQNSSTSQSPDYNKTTTLDSSAANPALPAEKAGGRAVAGREGVVAGARDAAGAVPVAGAAGADAAVRTGKTGGADAAAVTNAAVRPGVTARTGVGARASAPAGEREAAGTNAAGTRTANAGSRVRGRNHRGGNKRGQREDNTLAITAPANAGGVANRRDAAGSVISDNASRSVITDNSPGSVTGANLGHAATQSSNATTPRELGKVALQGLRPTKKGPYISDSALRAFTLRSTAAQLIRRGGAHINRSLELGVVAGPDFASVNSLAGDRPGSTIGLTVDYQFANHWYVGSGLLLDRKIFSAYGQDFHAPPGFYQANGLPDDVSLIKGTFEMLEIPLNVRYDFTVSGSTLFFISSGLSSYLLASQNNNYYYHATWNLRNSMCTSVSSPDKSYVFSALNLSVGVETGLSNSLSLLIAPYMKVPVRGVGIGHVQMSTVGINFALRFAPVISRKRY